MLIRVVYPNNKYDMVKDYVLNELIASGKIKSFYRSSGWAVVGRDRIRGEGGLYGGPERRKEN